MRAGVYGYVFVQGARRVCCVQYVAHRGDGSALGEARVSGGGSAVVGDGVTEALVVLITLGCGLPEPGGGNCDARSAARTGGGLFVHSIGAALNAHVHLHLWMLDGVIAPGR